MTLNVISRCSFILCIHVLLILNLPIGWTFDVKENFDFIIVGGGTAGSVVASRLSEIPSLNILLLEAGGEPASLNNIPYFAPGPFGGNFDWNLLTASQTFACGMFEGNICPWPSGKGLGGSTLINSMLHSRGNPNDFEKWMKLGNDGWGFEDVLRYFNKIEDYAGLIDEDNSKFHGIGGPITISKPPYKTKLSRIFLDVGRDLGYPEQDSEIKQKGFISPHFHLKNGLRWSAYKGYLEPARNRSNLKILTGAFVTKLKFDTHKRAVGLQFEYEGKLQTATAVKEVILAAGALKSPQILMLSGIGPKNILEKFKIHSVFELPGVGQQLQDSPAVTDFKIILNESVGFNRDISAELLEKWEMEGQGPLTVPGTCEGTAFLDSEFANKSLDWPDLEFIFAHKDTNFNLKKGKNFRTNTEIGKSLVYLSIILSRPKSFGFLEIKSANPHDPPLLNPNYLSDPQDLNTLLSAMKIFESIMKSTTFDKYKALYNYTKLMPKECKKYRFFSEDYLKCHIRYYSSSAFRLSGSCKMGKKQDKLAVVDQRLRVYGAKNLRVVDASIFPTSITGSPAFTVFMIAEKASDMIKEDWNVRSF